MSALLARRLPAEVLTCVRHRLASTSAVEDRDIVILGGGVAGLALAAALSASPRIRSACSVALIEGSDLSKTGDWAPAASQYENRVSSITADNKRLLERIGAWPHVETARTQGLASMQVWDGLSKARTRFDINDVVQDCEQQTLEPPAMAWLTENANLSRALMRSLRSDGHVELISPARVAGIEKAESGRPVLSLETGRSLQARLLIGADGFNSPVRKYAGIETTGWAYDTHAVVGTLEIEPQLDNVTAYQRFLPSGPIAFLPMSENAASLVWSTKPHYAKALKALDGQLLAKLVNAAFRLPWHSVEHLYRLVVEGAPAQTIVDEIEFRSSRACLNPDDIPSYDEVPPPVVGVQEGTQASFPLRYAHADAYVSQDRVALLGDAAHTIHPLAGQGLNLGLGDVAALSQVIETAVEQGADIGSLTSLQPYARARYLPNHAIMSAIDKLHKIYSTQSTPLVWARSVGLEVFNELSMVKAAIMGQAGASGEGAQTAASRTIWGTAASGLAAMQNAAAIAAPIAQRVGLSLAQSIGGRR